MLRIDWEMAAAVGARFILPGPDTTPEERTDLVRSLRSAGVRAHDIAVDVSGMGPAEALPVHVLTRQDWVRRNVAAARTLLGGTNTDGLPGRGRGRAAGTQLGLALGGVSHLLLGQFMPFAATPELYAVAPNVIQLQRTTGADPGDLHLWILVHEQTHRLQFAAAPWLADHLRAVAARLLDNVDVRPPRADLDQVTATMSILEGHAETIMNRVPLDLIPSRRSLQDAIAARRSHGGLRGVLRRMLGLDLKLAQYRTGADFCEGVLASAGFDVLNRLWRGPDTMPTPCELHDPQRWIERTSR